MTSSQPGPNTSLHLQALLEEYRAVSDEIRLYVGEMIRSFLYAAIIAGFYIGFGTGNQTLQKYTPYAFVLLVLYFLALAAVRVNLSSQRAELERAVNQLLGADRMTWDSQFASQAHAWGFLRYGPKWHERVPTPTLLLGFGVALAAVALFVKGVPGPETSTVFRLLIAGFTLAAYVFFVHPRMVRKARAALRKNGRRAPASESPPR